MAPSLATSTISSRKNNVLNYFFIIVFYHLPGWASELLDIRVSHIFIYLWQPTMIKTSTATIQFSTFGAGPFIRSAVEIYKPFSYSLHQHSWSSGALVTAESESET